MDIRYAIIHTLGLYTLLTPFSMFALETVMTSALFTAFFTVPLSTPEEG
jgi:hypothetical protein